MARNEPLTVVANIFRGIQEVVVTGLGALISMDLPIFKLFWKGSHSQSVELALSTVSQELENFLHMRKSEIQEFIAQAKNVAREDESISVTLLKESLPGPVTEARLDYLENFLLKSYTQEALRDWHDMKRIAYQRDFYRGRGDNNALSVLRKADQLAHECLQRAMKADIIDISAADVRPICYFDKYTAINRAPYTDLPLISVPLTATQVEPDLYAVLHEMGHYIYNHLNPKTMLSISKAIDDSGYEFNKPNSGHTVSNWLEEIFADTFAELVGGPEYNRQFRNYLLSGTDLSQETFELDDEIHPPVLIRLEDRTGGEWEQILDTLGIDSERLAESERQLRALSQIIKGIIAGVGNGGYLDLGTAQEYQGSYTYSGKDVNQLSLDLDTKLDGFRLELSSWGKDTWPTVPQPWPPGEGI